MLRRAVRGNLGSWAALALAPQALRPAAHHQLLMRELEAVARGECDRLMLLLPPGSAKSTYASLLFPPWWLARHPGSAVVATSHTASLARHFGRGVRALIEQHGPRLGCMLDPASRAAHRFGLEGGGSYFATGVRGSVTGRRADLVLVDDPIRSQAEADSPAARDHLWDWFRSDLSTRLRPGGRMVVIMTRWHPDDLAGRLLDGSDAWRVLRLPALAEPGDPLGRAEGAPLWPDWEDGGAITRKRAMLGERAFAALFQQDPRSREGRIFVPARIPVVSGLPPEGLRVRAWDLAASTAGNPDWTAGVLLHATPDQRFTVLDVVRLQGGPEMVEAAILAAAARDGPGVVVALPQDPGQAGRAQVHYLTRRLAGFRVLASPETGSKEIRAMPVASQANAGNLAILQAPWNRAFLEELQDFPAGAKDDQVDALSRGFSVLMMAPPPARAARTNFLGR
jgi:predicted phage terminase large subunit-like protein